MMRKKGKAYIGCSGFSYEKWLGMFYPVDVDKKHLLSYYARRFNTVEINRSFYSLPSPKTVRKWMDETPEGFRLCFKISRYITHNSKLLHPAPSVKKFMTSVHGSVRRKGPLLLQLPSSLKPQYERLENVLQEIQRQGRGEDWQVAIECRNNDWYEKDDLNAILDQYKASLVLHDMPAGRNDSPNTGAPFIYLRYHGPKGDYGGEYKEERLEKDAARIDQWLGAGKDVYAFFNNDRDGYAPLDALRLKKILKDMHSKKSKAAGNKNTARA